MDFINIYDAKAHFSKLVEAAMNGKEIVITKAGIPAAKLVPYTIKKARKFGVLKGKIRMVKDFDQPLANDFLLEFENPL